MNIDTFKHDFKQLNGVYATPQIVFFRKPLELYNLETGEVIERFRTLDEALMFELDGMTIKERVAQWTGITFPAIKGGRGGGGGGFSGGFPSGIPGGGEDKPDLPARMNVKIGIQRSYEDMLRAFTETHAASGQEHGIIVDEQGFTTRYRHGDRSSVGGLTGGQGIVIHNHPAAGWPVFSKQDLVVTALDTSRGIVAVSSKSGRVGKLEETAKYAGTYTFVKGARFDASGFIKAINSAQIRGIDVNSAAHSWLKRNQKKYGYKYSFVPAK